MKLESTLDERPGFLHVLPLFDLFMTAVLLLLLAPAFFIQSGVGVELPASQFQMQRYREAIVITLHAGKSDPQIYLGREAVDPAGLRARLEKMKLDADMSRAVVLLKTDQTASSGMQAEVIELVLGMGYKLALVGKHDTRGSQTVPTDE
ncbi:MAG: hypothetical protein RL346_503 [Verrucomicrobiota bacterium]